MLAPSGEESMVVQTSRRSFMRGMAVTATAAALLPVAAIARDADVGSEGLAYRTAGDLVKAIADRQVSSRELVDSAISRIEALDPKINAVVVREFDRARIAADAADGALARGEQRPLLGLPITVKEQFNVAGLPTTWGDPKFKDWRPDADALAVQRLKAAGAIIIGKTNVPLRLTDWQSYNEVYGTTNNPWDQMRTPGGSSGGAAAALAAGFVPLEFGSDIGGSLRCPAHFCGVFSHKPSLDLVPQRGSGPPQTPALPARGDLAVIGPMARSAADLALELAVVAGPDELADGIGYKLALPPPRHDKLADFRVLVIDKHPLCPTAASISAALDGLADRVAKLGCTVLRTSPKMPDLARTTRNYVELLAARRCRPSPSRTTTPSRTGHANSTSTAPRCLTMTSSCGPALRPLTGCRRPPCRSRIATAGYRSAYRLSAATWRTAPQSLLLVSSSASSAASPRRRSSAASIRPNHCSRHCGPRPPARRGRAFAMTRRAKVQ